jgi:tetratricopeptide (TPR) repeat protein
MAENNITSLAQQGILGKLSSAFWSVFQFGSLFCAIVVVVYAVWDAKTPVTIIVPFQMSKSKLPFTGDIVADAVQDGLQSIRNDIEEDRQDRSVRSWETGLPDLRNMLIPTMWRVQAPPRFTVEVKGVSYERVLSVARGVLRTETTISGDVIVDEGLTLVARSADAGPWTSIKSPATVAGLQQASRDLAEQILASLDPTVVGMEMLRKGQVDDSLAALKRAQSLEPGDPRLQLNLCMGFAANRRYDAAIECYEHVLNRYPSSSPEVWERLAQVYYLSGNRDQAIQDYEESRRRGDTQALLGLGEALDVSGRYQEALNVYDRFLATERVDRNLAIAHVKKSAVLAHKGKHAEALAEYDQALKYAPRDLLVLVHKSVELAESGDEDAAIAQLTTLIKENSKNRGVAFAHLQLGQLLAKKGDWRGACDHYREAARQPTYVEAHLKLADALVHEGQRSQALQEYIKVANLSPLDVQRGYSDIFAQQWLGNTLRDMGNYSGAAAAYLEAIRLKPNYGAAHCQLGLIRAKQGRRGEAIHHYDAALMLAKLKDLNDSECLVMAQRQVEGVLAKNGRDSGREDIFEVGKARQPGKPLPVSAHDVAGHPSDKQRVLEQAVLQTMVH